MIEIRTQTALVGAKLHSLKHYCPEAVDFTGLEGLADSLADRVERFDGTITPQEFRGLMELTLRDSDPEDYDLGSEGSWVLMQRLAVLDVVCPAVLPSDFTQEVKNLYRSKEFDR